MGRTTWVTSRRRSTARRACRGLVSSWPASTSQISRATAAGTRPITLGHGASQRPRIPWTIPAPSTRTSPPSCRAPPGSWSHTAGSTAASRSAPPPPTAPASLPRGTASSTRGASTPPWTGSPASCGTRRACTTGAQSPSPCAGIPWALARACGAGRTLRPTSGATVAFRCARRRASTWQILTRTQRRTSLLAQGRMSRMGTTSPVPAILERVWRRARS
mmetsp:Transcript_15063/g.38742  ORF Transcript_15063/g.38742 Transcript_15063/m.38742 type:complete len:219 (-) Transcript_15063:1287-1943(-)